jgi:hypothetical protein
MPILVTVTAINAGHVCAGTSQIDLITPASIGGVLGLWCSLGELPWEPAPARLERFSEDRRNRQESEGWLEGFEPSTLRSTI